jgi:hypothetical protein
MINYYINQVYFYYMNHGDPLANRILIYINNLYYCQHINNPYYCQDIKNFYFFIHSQ